MESDEPISDLTELDGLSDNDVLDLIERRGLTPEAFTLIASHLEALAVLKQLSDARRRERKNDGKT